jgi:hypothetical protein
MKLARKAIITITTTLALLAGASAAAATTASAATTAAASLTPNITWNYWSSYPTLHACNAEGDHLFLDENILTWKCPKYNKGDYFVWELFVVLGHPPGS